MRSNEILKILLSLPLAGGETLTSLLPPRLRSEARKAAATLLRSVSEVASSFAERAEEGRAPVSEETADADADDDGLRSVVID